MTEKLKKCPFCQEKIQIFRDKYGKFAMRCTGCNLYFGIEVEDGIELVDGWRAKFDTLEQLTEAWSTRADDENPEPTTEELIEFINDPDARQEQHEYAMYLLEKRMKDENPPLTLDELRGMNGEPVWIVAWPDWGHWELSMYAEDYFEDRDPDLYGLTMPHSLPDPMGKNGLNMLGWLAYRRKPEVQQ